MSKAIKPPTKLDHYELAKQLVIFCAGSIEMGKAVDWQTKIEKATSEFENVIVLNPRRDDWDCVDQDTMALTPEGPKPYDKLKVGDSIFTFSQDRDILEVQPIQKINIFGINGELIKFTRNDCSFYFTENHDLLDRVCSRHSRTRKVKAVQFLRKSNIVRCPAGKKVSDTEEAEIIPYGNGFSDDHFKLAAWFLSEGSSFNRKDTGAKQVVISQYKKNHVKIEEIEGILNRLGMESRYDDRMFILDKDSSDFISGILSLDKYKIPAWIMNASCRQKKIFIEEYAKGDGCIVNNKISYICFGGKYNEFAKQMQVLCFGAGIGTKWKDKTSGFGHPVINLVPHNEDKQWFCLRCEGKIPYNGNVWCPTTENGTWVAYRNGLPFITGNSSWVQSIDNPQFNEQVTWELDGQDAADLIPMYFDPTTKSPITLLELGIYASRGKLMVCCPEGFWRKGNVDMVCARYKIPQVASLEELISATQKWVESKKIVGDFLVNKT